MNTPLKQDHCKLVPGEKAEEIQYISGRGAQFNTENRFSGTQVAREQIESVDDWEVANPATRFIEQNVKTIVNRVESPDVGMMYSMNPYAGCEHGCIYCYARNVHEYWGYSAGLDFEQKIIVKINAVNVLRRQLMHPKWDAPPRGRGGLARCGPRR